MAPLFFDECSLVLGDQNLNECGGGGDNNNEKEEGTKRPSFIDHAFHFQWNHCTPGTLHQTTKHTHTDSKKRAAMNATIKFIKALRDVSSSLSWTRLTDKESEPSICFRQVLLATTYSVLADSLDVVSRRLECLFSS